MKSELISSKSEAKIGVDAMHKEEYIECLVEEIKKSRSSSWSSW